jgi:Protein of unknown function (DUF2934)
MKAKNRPISSAAAQPVSPRQIISERAYAIWLERGQPEGRDYEHWIEAERLVQAPIAIEPAETLTSKMTHWSDPLSTDIERALDELAPTSLQRSATSL